MDGPKLFQGASEEDALDGEMVIHQVSVPKYLRYLFVRDELLLTWLQVEEF
jgi:hypothetical protein